MISAFLARRRTARLLKCKPYELSMRSVYLPERGIIYLINPKVASSTIIRTRFGVRRLSVTVLTVKPGPRAVTTDRAGRPALCARLST